MDEPSKKEKVYEHDQNRFLNAIRETLRLKNDAALCRTLEVHHPLISKIRRGRSRVSAALLIRIHEVTDLSITDLRFLLGEQESNSTSVTYKKNKI
jgi:transcriptional regulator with XRE-family HTH domain